MITIIERGPKIIEECPVCGCKFTYMYEDLIEESHSMWGSLYYLNCPQCGKRLDERLPRSYQKTPAVIPGQAGLQRVK